MPDSEGRGQELVYAVVGLFAATAVALTIATVSRSRAAAPPVHSAQAPFAGASPLAQSGNRDAFSALQPTEMLQACFDCPLASYIGKIEVVP